MRDWRLPENRREAFMRFYGFHLEYKSHPGCVYSLLPAIADHYDLDDDGRAWLVWLNGNTQNPAMSLLLGEASDWDMGKWERAVLFWNEHFKLLDWDTDRRHQKGKFGEATESWMWGYLDPAGGWYECARRGGWEDVWRFSFGQPYMGRLSAWSMYEYARILLGPEIPDIGSWMLRDRSGSRSHRNGLAVVAGHDAWGWSEAEPFQRGMLHDLEMLAEELLAEAAELHDHPDVSRLTMESALCTYKSWHKPNRRYPNVYADMTYNRIKKAEARFGDRFQVLWDARQRDLPAYLRLEDTPHDPGLVAAKQNHYRETGEVVMMHQLYDDMQSSFNDAVELGLTPLREDKRW